MSCASCYAFRRLRNESCSYRLTIAWLKRGFGVTGLGPFGFQVGLCLSLRLPRYLHHLAEFSRPYPSSLSRWPFQTLDRNCPIPDSNRSARRTSALLLQTASLGSRARRLNYLAQDSLSLHLRFRSRLSCCFCPSSISLDWQ